MKGILDVEDLSGFGHKKIVFLENEIRTHRSISTDNDVPVLDEPVISAKCQDL